MLPVRRDLLPVLFFLTHLLYPVASPSICGPGTLLKMDSASDSSCQPCPTNTFNSAKYHNKTSCDDCFKVRYGDKYYDVVSECNSTANAVIRCKSEMKTFRNYGDSLEPCQRCRNCKLIGHFEKKPCSEDEDAVCCPVKGEPCLQSTTSTLSPTSGPDSRPKCVMKDLLQTRNSTFSVRSHKGCLQGELYICDYDNTTIICSPCPSETYMKESHHFHLECRACNVSAECNMEKCVTPESDCLFPVVITFFGTLFVTLLCLYLYFRSKNSGHNCARDTCKEKNQMLLSVSTV